MPIKRFTEIRLNDDKLSNKNVEVGVIHPSTGIYVYSIDIDERDFYTQNHSRNCEESITCLYRRNKNNGIFGNLKESFFGGETNEKIQEILYVGNDLVVVVLDNCIAELRSISNGSVIASIALSRTEIGFVYQVKK